MHNQYIALFQAAAAFVSPALSLNWLHTHHHHPRCQLRLPVHLLRNRNYTTVPSRIIALNIGLLCFGKTDNWTRPLRNNSGKVDVILPVCTCCLSGIGCQFVSCAVLRMLMSGFQQLATLQPHRSQHDEACFFITSKEKSE